MELWHSAENVRFHWLQPLMMGRTRRFSVREGVCVSPTFYWLCISHLGGDTLRGNNIFYIIGVIVVIIVVLKVLGLY
jgi:hypothetical protein